MASLVRLLVGVPIAGVVTFLLFLLMDRLILTDDFELEDEQDDLQIVIAEQVEELQVAAREISIDDVPEVQAPPPPPQIVRQSAEQPTEDMSTIVGEIPDFEAPSLSGADVNFNVSDRDAQPLVRIEPQYPVRAQERGVQGRCFVRFDVTPDGVTTNAEVFRCDSSLFERASVRAVERWRYQPAVENGVARWRRGVETMFIFQLEE